MIINFRGVFAKNGENPESVDYQVLRRNAENSNGGRPANEYKLIITRLPEMASGAQQNWRV